MVKLLLLSTLLFCNILFADPLLDRVEEHATVNLYNLHRFLRTGDGFLTNDEIRQYNGLWSVIDRGRFLQKHLHKKLYASIKLEADGDRDKILDVFNTINEKMVFTKSIVDYGVLTGKLGEVRGCEKSFDAPSCTVHLGVDIVPTNDRGKILTDAKYTARLYGVLIGKGFHKARDRDNFGGVVVFMDKWGNVVIAAHLDKKSLKPLATGQWVYPDTVLGIISNTGLKVKRLGNIHIHEELRRGRYIPSDPLLYTKETSKGIRVK